MKELYWITVIGNISVNLTFLFIITIIALTAVIIGWVCMDVDFEDERINREKLGKWIKRCGITAIILLVVTTFVPSEKQLLEIYGVGSVIDYVQDNNKAKALPDKAVEALTRYLNEVGYDEKENCNTTCNSYNN